MLGQAPFAVGHEPLCGVRIMSDYTEFFLNSSRAVVQLQLLEISHPSFSTTYRKVRNARLGVTVTHEDDDDYDYDYLPMKITPLAVRDDLDTGISVQFGDLGETLPKELDLIHSDDTYDTPPTVKYRTYRSDDLSAPLYGPLTLQIRSVTAGKEGASFEAKAPRLNYGKTGEIYSMRRFPMLRGFV